MLKSIGELRQKANAKNLLILKLVGEMVINLLNVKVFFVSLQEKLLMEKNTILEKVFC